MADACATGRKSRRKGKTGELELARLLTAMGWTCHRTAQCRGNTGQAADIEGLPRIWCEVKRTESFRLYEALRQAKHDATVAGNGELPAVFHRKNGENWVVIMDIEDWLELYRAYELGGGT